ncbi:MAG: hypothetical protein WDN75_11895 [Bacteroidota bacterium]
MISQIIADKINANLGDEITVHFFQDPPRFRKLKISGIYETNLSEYFDGKVIIGDLKLIQRLNQWPDSVAGGLEVYVKDLNKIDEVYDQIGESMDYDLFIEKVSDKYVQVFEWLGLVSRQVGHFINRDTDCGVRQYDLCHSHPCDGADTDDRASESYGGEG